MLAHGHRRPRHRCQLWVGLRRSRGLRLGFSLPRQVIRCGGWRQGGSCRGLPGRIWRHRLARSRDSRPRRKRCYPGPRVLLGNIGDVAGHLLLAGLELLDAGLELLHLLPHACEIARHRLQQRGRFGRWFGGGWRHGLRCGLSQRCRLRRCCVRRGRLNGWWSRLRGQPRFFR